MSRSIMDILKKITTNDKAIYLAYDHGMEHGLADFDEKSIDPSYVLDIAEKGGYNAIVLQKGLALDYWKEERKHVPLILKLNGKTNLYKGEALSLQETSVEFAKEINASAVGYTVYLGSQFEAQMIKEFGMIVEQAHKEKMPAIGWVYPRGKDIADDAAPEIVAYAARAGAELGADMVKIKYCGSKECFQRAVKAAGKTKVVLSGGPKVSDEEFLEVMRNVMLAGAAGVAVGRNVWQHPNPLEITEKIKKIVFG